MADLERLDAGALALLPFEAEEKAAGIAGEGVEGVDFGAEAGADDAALIERGGRVVREGGIERGERLGGPAEGGDGLGQERRQLGRGEPGAEVEDRAETVAEGREVARGGRAGADLAREPREVGDAAEDGLRPLALDGAADGPGDGVEAGFERCAVAERVGEPVAEQASAHRRPAPVDDGEERRRLARRGEDVEVAEGAVIDEELSFGTLGPDALDGPERPRVGLAQVDEEVGDGCGSGRAGEEACLRVLAELAGDFRFDGEVAQERTLDGGDGELRRIGEVFEEEFGDGRAAGFDERILAGDDADFAGRDVGEGERGIAAAADERAEVVRPAGFERRLGGDGARSDDADDVAGDEPFDFGGVSELFANGNPVAAGDELRDVLVDSVVGHAGKGHAEVFPHRLRGEGDLEFFGDELRVVVERFVKIAEAEEEDGARVTLAEVEVLLPDRRRHAAELRPRAGAKAIVARANGCAPA
ncbi:MAG: hypothetical protein KatS3mg064_0692 [Tepidiforma sp.]|nr:MAG: hypothetical protein KatS3mg064_0692 [Tepidiforma sp.]